MLSVRCGVSICLGLYVSSVMLQCFIYRVDFWLLVACNVVLLYFAL
jgi:hypothetical protein